jgi:hypothetical protein
MDYPVDKQGAPTETAAASDERQKHAEPTVDYPTTDYELDTAYVEPDQLHLAGESNRSTEHTPDIASGLPIPPRAYRANFSPGVKRIEAISAHLSPFERGLVFFGAFLIAYVYGLGE